MLFDTEHDSVGPKLAILDNLGLFWFGSNDLSEATLNRVSRFGGF